MNATAPDSGTSRSAFCNCSQPQKLVNQGPVYDRSLKIHRPRKRRGQQRKPASPKFL
jgi:hypothetical protein